MVPDNSTECTKNTNSFWNKTPNSKENYNTAKLRYLNSKPRSKFFANPDKIQTNNNTLLKFRD